MMGGRGGGRGGFQPLAAPFASSSSSAALPPSAAGFNGGGIGGGGSAAAAEATTAVMACGGPTGGGGGSVAVFSSISSVSSRDAEIESFMRSQLILSNVSKLTALGLVDTDEDGFTLRPTEAGRLMAHHCVCLQTMALVLACPPHSDMRELLRVVAKAEELSSIRLRKTEKKVSGHDHD